MPQISIYVPDTQEAKMVMGRAEKLEKEYGKSRSEIFYHALRLFVSVPRKPATQDKIRTGKLQGGFGA